jgi:NADPH:quinone reductase-like Zn-dependent oxidoreductase
MSMLVAGVHAFGDEVEMLELAKPRSLAADDVLIEVCGAGIESLDNIIRIGGWDVGAKPPMALGVEAAGVVRTVGAHASGFAAGDEVLCRWATRALRRRL